MILEVAYEDDQYVYTTGSNVYCKKIDKQYIREVTLEDAQQALLPGSWTESSWAIKDRLRYENVVHGNPEYYLDPAFVHTTWNQ